MAMRFRIHGRDNASHSPVEPFFVDAEDEHEARSRASELGTVAERVELLRNPLTPASILELRQIAAKSTGRHRVNWPPDDALALLDRLAALEHETTRLKRQVCALERLAVAARKYVDWCDGHGEVEHQRELWRELRAVVESLRDGDGTCRQ
jgi:coproporphyrinogen III oxidase